jgi:methyltransferase-like protein/SAM-dependent methyltransferase
LAATIKDKIEISGNDSGNAYDAVPYASFPYPYSSHERMYTIGRLFGMQPPDYKNARVLELGCASGGNILPLACLFPDGKFTGVDSSRVQIDMATAHARNLGLKNIEFRYQSILDITENLGKFDYIITHGILSWVPTEVQDKIFEVSNRNLSENGIAYISYNTYPGWNFIKCLRDMMLYHTANFSDPARKVTEAANLLEFIRKANKSSENNPYFQVIGNELKILEKTDASYLLHDHLEEHNEPCYFHQFMQKAQANSLQYLGETSLSSMYIGNLADEAAKTLWQIANDIVRVEQYMDFIRNRRFRCTLLTHANVKINRNLTPRVLEEFYMTTGLQIDADFVPPIPAGKQVAFKIPGSNISFNTSTEEVIEALKLLIKQGNKPIAIRELLDSVKASMGDKFRPNSADVILVDFLRLVFVDAIVLHASTGNFVTTISSHPQASSYARYQATGNNWVTNQKSEKINIDAFARVLLQYLDGNNNIEIINKKMLTHFKINELQINVGGKQIRDHEEIRQRIKPIIDNYLKKLVAGAVLIS